MILEPTLASKLGGEYRSGKRINMKRVIGYIASHFRKDKIWMRRTQPDKRCVVFSPSPSALQGGWGCSFFSFFLSPGSPLFTFDFIHPLPTTHIYYQTP